MDGIEALADAARAGDRRALARAISVVESGDPDTLRALISRIGAQEHARVIGVTGPPGAGKSTVIGAYVSQLRRAQRRVAVIAIDPSSPVSGGALLGDRIRLSALTTDEGVFIRSMATRGHLGGCAVATPLAIRVLDAVGFDDIVVETVGVGQSEIDVVALADVTVVVLAPGLGDDIQAEKAGILEVADVLAVNKSDLPGADRLVADLEASVRRLPARHEDAAAGTAIVRTNAIAPEGIEGLAAAIDGVVEAAELGEVRHRRTAAMLVELLLEQHRRHLRIDHAADVNALTEDVLAGRLDPYAAADALQAALGAADGDSADEFEGPSVVGRPECRR
ncbi:MAG: methylmalonyl Co-A mutase-associated GTPase MeaB [Nitriliruptoraceae bacterium]